MKKLVILISALALSVGSYAQNWTLDKAHAKLGFTVTHMMISDVDGMFKDFDASLQSSKPDFSDAVFTLTAKTNSIFTDNEKRDAHLKTADFFDADKNPTVTFKSTSIKKLANNKYSLKGDLTMHGVTKSVTLELTFKGQTTHPYTKKQVAGFKVTGTVKRSDFKIGESTPSAMVSDEVQLVANGEFTQS
jgi:polyisoprenoid-binding protein YceI